MNIRVSVLAIALGYPFETKPVYDMVTLDTTCNSGGSLLRDLLHFSLKSSWILENPSLIPTIDHRHINSKGGRCVDVKEAALLRGEVVGDARPREAPTQRSPSRP